MAWVRCELRNSTSLVYNDNCIRQGLFVRQGLFCGASEEGDPAVALAAHADSERTSEEPELALVFGAAGLSARVPKRIAAIRRAFVVRPVRLAAGRLVRRRGRAEGR